MAASSIAPSGASASEDAAVNEQVPTVVTAKTLVADNKKRTVTYKTGVVVKRGDVTLYADEVIIRLSGDNNASGGGRGAGEFFSGPGSVETIEAKGGVRIVQGDKTATADEALYKAGEEKIILKGRPRMWQGPNVLTGSSISFNVAEDTVVVEDAKTVLYQGGDVPGAAGGTAR